MDAEKEAVLQRRLKGRPEAENFLNSLYGRGTYRDTGRQSSGPGEAIDSYIGAPARQAVGEAQDGNFDLEALKRIAARFGADPQKAPTGYDIASKATDNPYLGTAMATAVDVGAQLPVGLLPKGLMPMGLIGEIKGVKDAGKLADATEAFAERGKAPASADVKIAQLHGETGEVRSAMPQLIQNAKDEMAFGKETLNRKKEWESEIIPSQGFWHDENDHRFTDEAKQHMDALVARFGVDDEAKTYKALKEANSAPDHQTYSAPKSMAKGYSGLPNYAAQPMGQIGKPGMQNAIASDGGNPEPFPWMDHKYGAGKQLLLRHKSLDMPVTVNTSSDLIAHSDYIAAMPKDTTVNLYFGPSDPEVMKQKFPGNPSNKRLESAAERLQEAGIKVNKIYPDNTRSLADKPKKGGD